jgi:hypothetical protein
VTILGEGSSEDVADRRLAATRSGNKELFDHSVL